jgi:DNA-binding NtrC family response regulator
MSLQILVVDDNCELAENLAELLTDEGHRVRTANSGAQALALASEQRFDFVLTDFRMPVMNGIELIKLLHARDPDVTYLLMTAHHADTLLTTEAERRIIDAILSKPLPLDRLFALIQAPAGAQILLVEDDIDLADALGISLESRGFRVRIAHDLTAARDAIAATLPDIAIVDVVLPDGDGVALIRELYELAPASGTRGIQVVLMTGLGNFDADELRRLAPGSIQFLIKPFTPDTLVKALKLLGCGGHGA